MKALKFLAFALAASSVSVAQAADPSVGEKTYNTACFACHAAGVLNSPKLGDKAAWAPRIKQGKPTLYKHALSGFNQMPAKGGNAGLKDEDVKAAVDFMVSKAS